MHIPARSTLIAASAAALLALGVGGTVLAHDGGSTGTQSPDSTGLRRPHRHPIRIGLYEIVEASGIDSEVFREGWANGQSISDTLTANGLDPATVQADVLADLKAKLDAKVAAGELDQARADEILANSTERLARFMAHVRDGDHPHPIVHFAAGRGVVQSAAETIGITVRELLGEVRDTDGSIASVAEAHGVEPQTVIDNAVSKALGRIDEAEANGRLTAERAAQLRENVPTRIATFINEGPKAGEEQAP